MNKNYVHISVLGGNELIKQFTTKHILHTHKQTNYTLHKTHTSATLTSNIFQDQPSITASVQLCYNVLCWVKLMIFRTEIKHLTVYCMVQIKSITPKNN